MFLTTFPYLTNTLYNLFKKNLAYIVSPSFHRNIDYITISNDSSAIKYKLNALLYSFHKSRADSLVTHPVIYIYILCIKRKYEIIND